MDSESYIYVCVCVFVNIYVTIKVTEEMICEGVGLIGGIGGKGKIRQIKFSKIKIKSNNIP